MVRHRENPVASLCLQWNSRFFKEFHYVLGRERIESTVQEFRVRHNCPEQLFRVTVICNIASAFSCNIYFLSKFLVFLQDVDLMSCPCQINASHHSGSTAAYDQYFTHLHTFHKTDLQLFSNYRKLHKFYLYFSKRHVQKASLHVSFIIFVSKVSIGQTLTNYSSLIKPDMLRFWYQQPSHPPFSPEPDDT